jgi:hypothetical protein
MGDKTFLEEKQRGFGSSDASAIIAYAKTGELSTTLARRIGEIKGEVERLSFSSKYTDLGNKVEDDYHDNLLQLDPATENNPKNYFQNDEYDHFTMTHHIDFRYTETRLNANFGDVWVELKSVKKSSPDEDLIEKTFQKYLPQLAWHFMIMKSINEDGELKLEVYDTTDCYQNHDLYVFDEFNIESREINFDDVKPTIQLIFKGLDMLSKNWETFEVYSDKEKLEFTEEEFSADENLSTLYGLIIQEKQLKDQIAAMKKTIMASIEATDVKSIYCEDRFTISYAAPSVAARLDKKKVEALLGDKINECYTNSNRAGSLRINLPKNK